MGELARRRASLAGFTMFAAKRVEAMSGAKYIEMRQSEMSHFSSEETQAASAPCGDLTGPVTGGASEEE